MFLALWETKMLDRTLKKLREAEFFLGRLLAGKSQATNREPEASDFYFSAFFTAARSVAFILRIENSEEKEPRSRDWLSRLSVEDHDLMDFFGATDNTFTTVSLIEFMQDAYRRGVITTPQPPVKQSETRSSVRPEDSIDAGCQTYLGLLKQLVAEFEREHPNA